MIDPIESQDDRLHQRHVIVGDQEVHKDEEIAMKKEVIGMTETDTIINIIIQLMSAEIKKGEVLIN